MSTNMLLLWIYRLASTGGALALVLWTSGFWHWVGFIWLIGVVLRSVGFGKVPRRVLEVPGPGEGVDVMLIEIGENDLDILKVYGQFSDRSFEEMDALIDDGDGHVPAPMGVCLTERDAEEFVALIAKHGGKAEIIRD